MKKKFTLFLMMAAVGIQTSSSSVMPIYASSQISINEGSTQSLSSVLEKNSARVIINGVNLEVPGGVVKVKGQKLYPLRWMAEQMGGTVRWDQTTQTAIVNNPLYNKEHLYLNYLGALLYNDPKAEYTLPERIRSLKLPPYPLNSESGPELHETPIGITIENNGFMMEFAAYGYEFRNNKIYVTADWLNTIFLAQVIEKNGETVMTHPTEEELDKNIEEIQNVLLPATPEETLALWIRGQQVRSGALQYSSLSPELKEQVMQSKRGWVTGGSSPSAGKARIISKKQTMEGIVFYELSIDEMLEGKVWGTVKEELTVRKYEEQGKTYWLISSASGELDEFSILSSK